MINPRLTFVIAVLVVACGSAATPPPAAVTIRSGESSLTTLPAGRYRFAWSGGCASLELSWAPVDGRPAVTIPVDAPGQGSAVVTIPGGQAYMNGAGSCAGAGYQVTIEPEP